MTSIGERLPGALGPHRDAETTAYPHDRPAPGVGPGPPPKNSGRRLTWGTCVLLGAAIFLQAPGRIVPETKLDLLLGPVDFMARALHLWDPRPAFGQVPDQAVGYLFPMGPFYAVARMAHVPMWVVQRAWMTLLLTLALWGMVKVAGALAIGTPGTRLIGATAYALAPAMLSQVTTTSGGQTAAALLPWVMLPLINGSRGGSTTRSVARSALAVTAMGGINATAVLAVLPLPFLWLVTRPRSARRRALLWQWPVAVILGTLWWIVPLVLQHHYGEDFTRFTERASITAATGSAFEAVRGTSSWVAHLFVTGPWLRGAWMLVSAPVAVFGTAAVAAAGLTGLALPSLPERRFLVLGLLVGVLAITAGYAGGLSGPLAGPLRTALDGFAAAFRNVNKFDPVLRFCIVLGLVHLLTVVAARLSSRPPLPFVGAAAVVLALTAAALPLLEGQITAVGSFRNVPGYWRATASWLNAHADGGRTLVLPAAPFGEYTWGRPLDEPLQSLMRSPWAVRDLVPLGSDGAVRLLDAVDRVIDDGQGSSGLVPTLQRAGVRYLVVRNDLDMSRSTAPAPAFVRQALTASGISARVAAFGPSRSDGLDSDRLPADLGAGGRAAGFRAVEVYEVPGGGTRVMSYAAADAATVDAGPESVLDLADAGLLGDRPLFVAGDSQARKAVATSTLVSDATRRRDVQFGAVRDNFTYTLSATERAAGHAGAPIDRLVVPGARHETVARTTGAAAVRASSVLSYPIDLPEAQPFAAFDGDITSAWVPDVVPTPLGQWIEIAFDRPITPAALSVSLLRDQPYRPLITKLHVSTETGVLDEDLAGDNPHVVRVPPGPTRWVRLTIAGVYGLFGGTNGPGISEIVVPGVTVSRPLVTPPPTGAGPAAYAFSRSTTDPYDPSRHDEDVSLDRVFSTKAADTFTVRGSAVVRPSVAFDRVRAGVEPPGPVTVSASSVWNFKPAFGAARAIDGDTTTAWVASPGDPLPYLHVAWTGVRRVDSLEVVPADGPTLRPVEIRIDSPAGTRAVQVLNDQPVSFAPLDTDQLTITVVKTNRTASATTPGLGTAFAVGIGEVRIPAIADLLESSYGTGNRVDLPCGSGPNLRIDGETVATQMTGVARRDLVELRPVPFTACGPLHLSRGTHRIETGVDGGLAVDTLSLRPSQWHDPTAASRRVKVTRWDTAQRTVSIGPGDAAVLATTESYSPGWHATLAGRNLAAVRVDGWRQAWLVPAGTGGTVRQTFAPDHTYRLGLLAGALAVVLLLALATLVRPRPPARDRSASPSARQAAPWRHRTLATSTLTAGVGFVVAGPVGAAAAASIALLVPRRWLPAAAGGLFAAAACLAVRAANSMPGSGHGVFSRPVQFLSVAAVAAVCASLRTDG